jgi:carbon storage regulator CsrA
MLVLTRKQQEKIRIGDDIVITVLRMKGKYVRLGIEAPSNVQVLRGELVFESSNDRATPQEAKRPATPIGELPKTAGKPRPGHGPAWTAKSHPSRRDETARSDDAEFSVQLHRVTRDSATAIMSQLVPTAGPLKAMLDSRMAV